jgi:type I restriction enzyme S subunit
LEGLEVSEIRLSQLERTARIDSEFYKKGNILTSKVLSDKFSVPITNFVGVSDGNHMTISDSYVDDGGIPYYRGSDIYNFFIEQSPSPLRIDEKIFNVSNMKRSHLKEGDVLISIVGAIIGNLSLVKTNAKATCSCKLAILRPKENVSELIAIFLKSEFGQNQIQKFKRGAAQTGLILEDFDQILVPKQIFLLNSIIEKLVGLSYKKLEDSYCAYSRAESLLLSEIGFDGFVPSADNINTKNYSESFLSSGRLDSEYYQPKYEQYEQAVLGCSLGHTLIQDEFVPVKEGANLTKSEYKYIEIGDVNVGDGSCNYTIRPTEELPANAKYLVQKGDLLISKVRPNRGAVTIIPFDEPDLIVSGAFTVLRAKPKSVFSNETLKVLLRTSVYKDWLLKFNVGTQYPVIKDEDILNLPIPKISAEKQLEISTKIKEAEVMRHKSESLLEIAKRAVEIAIEQDEIIAERYIQDECQKIGVSL